MGWVVCGGGLVLVLVLFAGQGGPLGVGSIEPGGY